MRHRLPFAISGLTGPDFSVVGEFARLFAGRLSFALRRTLDTA
jgi:hypothetical protein